MTEITAPITLTPTVIDAPITITQTVVDAPVGPGLLGPDAAFAVAMGVAL